MTFREAVCAMTSLYPDQRVSVSYSETVDPENGDCTSIWLHVGDRCVHVQSYEAGIVELAKIGKTDDQAPGEPYEPTQIEFL